MVVLDFSSAKDGFLDKINYLIIAQTNREERIQEIDSKRFKEDIMARMEVQMPSEDYGLANKIINNDSNQKELEEKLLLFEKNSLAKRIKLKTK